MTNDLAHYHSILKNKGIVDSAEKILCEFLIVSPWQLSISHKTSALMLGPSRHSYHVCGPTFERAICAASGGTIRGDFHTHSGHRAVTLDHLSAILVHYESTSEDVTYMSGSAIMRLRYTCPICVSILVAIDINDPGRNARAQLEGEGEDAAEGESAADRKEDEKVGLALIMSVHCTRFLSVSSKFSILAIESKQIEVQRATSK
jgi:hypothetical protein